MSTRNFFGGLLMLIGVLFMLFFGGCAVVLSLIFISSKADFVLIALAYMFCFIPFLIGFGLVKLGNVLRNKKEADEKINDEP